MNKTLEENGVADESEEFYKLSMNEELFLPALHLYLNDDLTEAQQINLRLTLIYSLCAELHRVFIQVFVFGEMICVAEVNKVQNFFKSVFSTCK